MKKLVRKQGEQVEVTIYVDDIFEYPAHCPRWSWLRRVSFMKRLVEYELEDGNSVVIEVVESDDSRVRAATEPGIIHKAQQSFETALRGVQLAAEAMLKQITHLGTQPNEVNISYGLKIAADVGAIIASGSVEANCTVKLTWTKAQVDADSKP